MRLIDYAVYRCPACCHWLGRGNIHGRWLFVDWSLAFIRTCFLAATGSILFVCPVDASQAIVVKVGLKVNQVMKIDQKSENFSVVATLMMKWREPELAEMSGETFPARRMYGVPGFLSMMEKRKLPWPEYSFYNLQGRADHEIQLISIDRLGNVIYFARFSATLQAPDFDFSHFPLDHQTFHIKLDSLRPEAEVIFEPVTEDSGLSDTLGEEEWQLEFNQINTTKHNEMGYDASRVTLTFQGYRHLDYYVVRIFIPAAIIVLVSWFTLFLNDYSKRIDLASGNLLLFIAFNFTIANDLPRLGYLTLMDTFLLSTFVITGLVVLANVCLRWLQNHGMEERAAKLDFYGVLAYPLVYMGGALLMILLFYE